MRRWLSGLLRAFQLARARTYYKAAPCGSHPFSSFCAFMHKKADEGIRTRDLLITNELLYQLSYIGIYLVYFSESSIRHRSTF